MNILRTIEEMRYVTKEVKSEDAKQFSPSLLMRSLMTKSIDTSRLRPTVFVDLVGVTNLEYLVIHICDIEKYGNEVQTLVCQPEHRLSDSDEELLLYYCTLDSICINKQLLGVVVNEYDRLFPHTNIELYESRPAMSVMHMYFCLFKGVRELIYKAQLSYLATGIEKIDDINLLPVLTKGSPVNLFEKGFTQKLLRLLNTHWGIQYLCTAERRQETLEIYQEYSHNLGGYYVISHSQWLYLRACYRKKLEYNKNLFRFFGKESEAKLFEDYVVFLAKKEMINRKMAWCREFSTEEEFYKCMEVADFYLQYLCDQDKWDHYMWTQNYRRDYLDYSDERYTVIHPMSVQDIFNESEQQNNCLRTMYRNIAAGVTDIGFMRKTDNVGSSFITFEVCDKEVTQIFMKNNSWVDRESKEMKWFSMYMKKKGLRFDKGLQAIYDENKHSHMMEFLNFPVYEDVVPFD